MLSLSPIRLFCISFLLLSSVHSSNAVAQSNVWDNRKNVSKKAYDKLDKGKKGIKKWKEHVENWGMDDKLKHQFALGGKLNSNGWSGCIYYFNKTGKTTHDIYQLSFSEIKHEKQVKQQRGNAFPELGQSGPYVYGKINNLYTLNIGYGKQHLLLPGVVDGNLSVSFRYSGGLSLAMLKPYYLKLVHIDYANDRKTILTETRYTDSTAAVFLKSNNILSASKWSKGLDETKFIPGGFVEAAFVIEPSKSKFLVTTITLGANGSLHAGKLPIMAEIKSYPWQANVFVGLSLGKRWE